MILFATQNFLPDVGGTQLYVTGLADALAKRGHALEVYCDASSRVAAREIDAPRPYPIRRFGGFRPWLRWRKARAAVKRIEMGHAGTLITDTWKSLELLPAATLAKVRVVCLAHGSEFLVPPGSRKERRLRAALAKVDLLAANSHFTATLARPFATGGTEVRVIPPGVTPPFEAPSEPPAENANPPRILTIARLEPRKGIDMVLRALPALRKAHPELIYDIVGKGEDKTRLTEMAKTLGVGDCVRFHGYISEWEKAALIAGASVFALPNRREPGSVEGFGIVFLEAAAYGIPALAGIDGGTADAVVDCETGFVVQGDSEKAVYGALQRLLFDRIGRARMGAAAHARFWNEFAWDAAVARFEAVLRRPGAP